MASSWFFILQERRMFCVWIIGDINVLWVSISRHVVFVNYSCCILTYLLYSMAQSPSWEANWFAASQEIPRMSRNPKVHYRTHKRPPPVSILGQPNPVHISTSHLLEIHPHIIHVVYSISNLFIRRSYNELYQECKITVAGFCNFCNFCLEKQRLWTNFSVFSIFWAVTEKFSEQSNFSDSQWLTD